MTFNRKNQFLALEKLYKLSENATAVLYADAYSDVNEILKEFLVNKDFFYYKAVQVSEGEQLNLFADAVSNQLSKHNISEKNYSSLLKAMMDEKCEKRIVVIDEFQYIVKYSDELIDEIIKCVNNKWGNQPVLFLLVSTNSYFIENQLVEKMGNNAYELSGLVKVSDLSFIDTIQYFNKYSKTEQILAYGITGGKYKYITAFDPNVSLKENIINEILISDGRLFKMGFEILPRELREYSVYNTILVNIALGHNKLNELHKITGYSRAKISVYLNNLISHNLIEKIDSFETDGKDNTLKGIYSIKNGFNRFFYRFVFSNISMLNILSGEKFYNKYVLPFLYDFGSISFGKVCNEYLALLDKMGKLPISIVEMGTWVGKVGNIDIVCQDEKNNTLIGYCEFKKDLMSFEDFEWLQFCVKQAKLNADIYYLFSKKDFDERIKEYAEQSGNVVLIDLSKL